MAINKYLDAFMKTFPFEGLTYDDVTLVTQYADFLPDDASLETKLTSRQKMKVPFISAAMERIGRTSCIFRRVRNTAGRGSASPGRRVSSVSPRAG